MAGQSSVSYPRHLRTRVQNSAYADPYVPRDVRAYLRSYVRAHVRRDLRQYLRTHVCRHLRVTGAFHLRRVHRNPLLSDDRLSDRPGELLLTARIGNHVGTPASCDAATVGRP
jgi:hypothetical protein